MNVLIINPILATPTPEGIQRLKSIKDTMIYGMALGFMRLGHNPTLIAAADFIPTEKEEYPFEVVFLPTKYRKPFDPSLLPYIPTLKNRLRKNVEKFDLIISKECFSLASLTACRIAPQKTIVWQEMNLHQRKLFQLPSKLWYNIVARFFMRKAKAVTCSTSARDFLRRYMPLTADTIIEHGIDGSKFSPLEKKERTLITSSTLTARKNVGSIIRKFAALHEMPDYEDIKLIICGDGDQRAELEQLSRDLKLEDYIDFRGFLPRKELGKLVASSLAFLVDTLQDLNVISIVESIVAGTPVVTNMIPLTASWINEQHLGIARDDWDATDLATIIDQADNYAASCCRLSPSLTCEAAAAALISLA